MWDVGGSRIRGQRCLKNDKQKEKRPGKNKQVTKKTKGATVHNIHNIYLVQQYNIQKQTKGAQQIKRDETDDI